MSTNYQPTPEELNREEEYDDNVIINSWEASLEEYKRHHSIKSDSEEEPSGQPGHHPIPIQDQPASQEPQEIAAAIPSPPEPEIQQAEVQNPPSQATQRADPQTQVEPPLPMEGMDPELKNLLMSWYWAGYYHGLYVGKNKQ